MTFDDEINDVDENNQPIDSVVKMDDSSVLEETRIQKDISNDIFKDKNESLKSDESASDLFENNSLKFENQSNEEIEVAGTVNVEEDAVRNASSENTDCKNKDSDHNIQTFDTKHTNVSNTNNTQAPDTKHTQTFTNENIQSITKIAQATIDVTVSENTTDTQVLDSDDPLQRPKFRKTENLSCGVPIRDFSDPLRATLSVEDDVFLPKEEASLKADAQNERYVLLIIS